jgi:hypothetical protein
VPIAIRSKHEASSVGVVGWNGECESEVSAKDVESERTKSRAKGLRELRASTRGREVGTELDNFTEATSRIFIQV